MQRLRKYFPFNAEQTINILSEFGPLVTMFVVNAVAGIDAGTVALLITTLMAIGVMFYMFHRPPMFPLIASTVTVVFGAMTLYTHDPMWVQIKVTIFNALFALFLIVGLLIKHNFFKYVFETTFHYTDKGWNQFTWSFALFFIFTAIANEYVRQTFIDDHFYRVLGKEMLGVNVWILFKVAFILPLSGLYAWFLTWTLQKHRLPDPPPHVHGLHGGESEEGALHGVNALAETQPGQDAVDVAAHVAKDEEGHRVAAPGTSLEQSDDARTEKPASEFDRRQGYKMLVELGPLVVFFLVNWLGGKYLPDSKAAIFWATGSFMVTTLIALVASRTLFGKVAAMPLVTGVFVLIFGGLTLYLQDEHFIKMKPTIVNALFSALLLAGLAMNRTFLKIVFGDVMKLTEEGWRKLTVRWALFFAALALLNEVVWRLYSTDTWVTFKVFGIMPLTILFALAQVGLLKKYEAHG